MSSSGPYAKLSESSQAAEDLEFSHQKLEFSHHHLSTEPVEVTGKIGASPALNRIQATASSSSPLQGGVPVNTLDEPIKETIMRDLRNIWTKILQVLDPRPNNKQNVLKDWDWWGPLLLCLALSIRLSYAATQKSEDMFATIFVIIWSGAVVVTLNAQLLGGKISFFQSVCVLGYCIFPLVIASYICLIPFPSFITLIIVAIAFSWSTYASMNFLTEMNLEKKKILALYPIFLFYFTISWLIFLSITSKAKETAKPTN